MSTPGAMHGPLPPVTKGLSLIDALHPQPAVHAVPGAAPGGRCGGHDAAGVSGWMAVGEGALGVATLPAGAPPRTRGASHLLECVQSRFLICKVRAIQCHKSQMPAQLCHQMGLGSIPAPPLSSYRTVGEALHRSVPPFLIYKTGLGGDGYGYECAGTLEVPKA